MLLGPLSFACFVVLKEAVAMFAQFVIAFTAAATLANARAAADYDISLNVDGKQRRAHLHLPALPGSPLALPLVPPLALLLALLTLPGALLMGLGWEEAFVRSLSVLVVACPVVFSYEAAEQPGAAARVRGGCR